MLNKYSVTALALVFAVGVPVEMRLKAARAKTLEVQEIQVSDIPEPSPARRFVPGEVIVKRRPAAGVFPLNQMSPLGLDATVTMTSGGEFLYRLPPSSIGLMSAEQSTNETLALVEQLRKRPDVEYAQPNYLYEITQTTPNDPVFNQQWHYLANGTGAGNSPGGIGLPAVWALNKGDSRVVVAVIDTGILPKHPDIVGSPNLLPGYDMIDNQTAANDGDARDADPTDPGDAVAAGECGAGRPIQAQPSSWHGTHVGGSVGVGNTNNNVGVAGINWHVNVLPVRVLGKCGGSTADIIDAIRWAAGMTVPGVPNNPAANKAKVINMSLGGAQPCLKDNTGPGDPAMQSAISDAVKLDVTVVVAAGNAATDASKATPASCNGVITVAASDFRGHLATRYSNFGRTVEIMAPGGDVRRDDNQDNRPDGVLSMVDGGYAFSNGTSMAAPHVAGVAALLLACNPNLSPGEVLKRIQATALTRNNTHDCPTGRCGAGLLNAAVAMRPACAAGGK